MQQLAKSLIHTLLLVVFMLLYVSLGAVIFVLLEGHQEDVLRRDIRNIRTAFLNNHSCIKDAELEEFIIQIVKANNRGVSAARNVTSEPNWSFGQSFFFAGSVVTTIGYGHVAPLSEGGKIFCMVYAIIGIPLTLVMFTALVERLMLLTGKILDFLTSKMGHLYRALHIRLGHLTMILGVLLVLMFFIPAAIFSTIEGDWTYLDAFYYCFISLTTIGLGDYIPGDQPEQANRALYKILTTVYLFTGLIFMMLFLANIYEVPELNLGHHFYMKSDDDDAERLRLRKSNDPGPKYTQQVDQSAAGGSGSVNQGADVETPDDDDRQALSQ